MEFNTTRWSIVAAAKSSDLDVSQRALEELCQLYWFPIYSFVRSKGLNREESEDSTQSFFVHFLDNRGFEKADCERGNFRTFLLSCAKNFLIDEWKKGKAQKRGNGMGQLTLDFERAERLVNNTVDLQRSPEEMYDYLWAKTIMARALNRLRKTYAANGNIKVFRALKIYLENTDVASTFAETAASIGMTEGAVKVAVHRLRTRYKAALESEIVDTLVVDGDIDSEVQHIIDAVSLRNRKNVL